MLDPGDIEPLPPSAGTDRARRDDRFAPVLSVNDLVARRPATVRGRLAAARTVPGPHGPRFEAVLDDTTSSVVLVFLGRRSIPGLVPGTVLMAHGTPRLDRGRIEILNPLYELLAPSQGSELFDAADATRSDP